MHFDIVTALKTSVPLSEAVVPSSSLHLACGKGFRKQHFFYLTKEYPILISTEGALRRPMTYDNHPIPSVRNIALNELTRPEIDLS